MKTINLPGGRLAKVRYARIATKFRSSEIDGPTPDSCAADVPLFDHLVDIGELLGQSRFPKALDHQLRSF